MKTNLTTKLMACIILYPLAALSVHGNVELFGGASASGWWFALCAFIGLELGLLTLISSAARTRNPAALALACVLMVVSIKGQYAFLLTQANGHETNIEHARTAQVDNTQAVETLRTEAATLQSALDTERKSGWGPKTQAIAARLDNVKGEIAKLQDSTVKAQDTEAKASPLLVMCKRFNLPVDSTLNIDAAITLIALNAAGFMLLFLANAGRKQEATLQDVLDAVRSNAPAPVSAPAPAPVAAPVVAQTYRAAPNMVAVFKSAPEPEWLKASRENIKAACEREDWQETLAARKASTPVKVKKAKVRK